MAILIPKERRHSAFSDDAAMSTDVTRFPETGSKDLIEINARRLQMETRRWQEKPPQPPPSIAKR